MKKIILICIAAITFCGLQAQNNWEKIELPDSVNFSQVYCLDENIVFAFAGKFFGGSNTLYKSSDGGKSWKVVLIDIHPKQGSKKMFPAKMSFINQNIGYLVMDCQFYKTTDAGENWSCLGFSPWGQTSLGRLLAIDEDNIWLLSDYGDLMISNDGGKTFHFNMMALMEIGYCDGVVYALIPKIGGMNNDNVLITNDMGKTWDFVPNTYLVDELIGFSAHDLVLHSSNSATFNGKNNLVITEDGFKTVSMIPYPSQPTDHSTIVFIDKYHGFLLNKSLYYTEQRGKIWMQEHELDNEGIVDIDGKGGTWYAIAHKRLFKTHKVLQIQNPVMETVNIYPNPVNDSFRIECGEKQIKKVDIYDITGRVVLTSNSHIQNTVNIQQLTKGIYIAKIYVENQVFNTKIINQ